MLPFNSCKSTSWHTANAIRHVTVERGIVIPIVVCGKILITSVLFPMLMMWRGKNCYIPGSRVPYHMHNIKHKLSLEERRMFHSP